jgi:hypothetical protein
MTSHNPSRARRRTRNLLYAVVGLTLTGIAWIAMAWVMQRLQAARCPENAFFWGSSQIAVVGHFRSIHRTLSADVRLNSGMLTHRP